jgi:signal transduction protein with GAF and PtsI domain
MVDSLDSGRQLRDEVQSLLTTQGVSEAKLLVVLDRVLAHFGCVTGTIHRLDPASGMLRLLAQRGIPDTIRDRVEVIPIGKGMAGLAAERRQPVQVCNLQTDTSGVAKPGARETRMEGAIAVPMLAAGTVCGVLGVAKPVVHEFSAAETALLQAVADDVGQSFGP